MLSMASPYYTENYASIIDTGLVEFGGTTFPS